MLLITRPTRRLTREARLVERLLLDGIATRIPALVSVATTDIRTGLMELHEHGRLVERLRIACAFQAGRQ